MKNWLNTEKERSDDVCDRFGDRDSKRFYHSGISQEPMNKEFWKALLSKQREDYPCKDEYPDSPPCVGGPAEMVCDECPLNLSKRSERDVD